jgi:3-oxoacyl-[acyl-carrier-protein] synthase-1
MDKGVAVTGIGVMSAIGSNTEMNYQALISSKNGISFPEILQTKHTHLPVAEIKLSNNNLAENLKLEEDHLSTRAALLGVTAIKEAVNKSQLKIDSQTGLISGTSVGGIDATEKFFREFSAGNAKNERFIKAQHPGFTTEIIAK